ncbi:AAA domain-containing protein [Helicobacter sp.]|uniref:AAA domain-containing protein n=1 Tax=Helicobacter sp. TaxID=218 RepID=UPI00388D4537
MPSFMSSEISPKTFSQMSSVSPGSISQETHHTSPKAALIQACKVYYDYLLAHNLGCEEIGIVQIQCSEPVIKLRVRAKMLNTDSLQIKIDSTLYFLGDESGFQVLFYDEKTQVLAIECADLTLFRKISKNPAQIKIFSDLKFLIRNLEQFFEQSNEPSLPTNAPIFALDSASKPGVVSSLDFNSADSTLSAYQNLTIAPYLHEEQARALRTILINPFSYVWGAPGSGKTQAVLFEALLHYIYRDKQVCVLAPTNSALEQVLKALIVKFDTLGLDRAKILRLGTPSTNFLERFVEVCDPQILQQKQPQSLFGGTTLKSRLKDSLVVGMTMDGFIKRYKGLGMEFAHFFLDECAFTPLSKALALATQSAPITLLGDHKQLMPICEMPQSCMQGEQSVANLFNLSALFMEDFLTQSNFHPSAPIFHKPQTTPLQFTHTSLAILRQTHRYGDNLAKILDHHIYHNGLCGKNEPTQLYFIDCKSSSQTLQNQGTQDKMSHAEAQVIAKLFPTLDPASSAIITPFVRQRKLLYEYKIPYKHTWTIHGSQGQEFECVVFSPVMLHYHLTDSRNLNAAYALNVAISRIKKCLILVCDYAYWINRPEQFLTEILRHAIPYPVSALDSPATSVDQNRATMPQRIDIIPI